MKIFEEYNLSTETVFTALPGQLTSHRVLDLPFADFKKVDATIEFEMENYLPLPLEEVLIDYQFLESSQEGKKKKEGSTVLASYARKSEFVKFLNLMNEANLDPHFVGSEPVEMANIMKLGGLQAEGVSALIDISAMTT